MARTPKVVVVVVVASVGLLFESSKWVKIVRWGLYFRMYVALGCSYCT